MTVVWILWSPFIDLLWAFFFVFSSSILDVHNWSEKLFKYSVNDNSLGKMCRFQEWLVDQILYCKKTNLVWE